LILWGLGKPPLGVRNMWVIFICQNIVNRKKTVNYFGLTKQISKNLVCLECVLSLSMMICDERVMKSTAMRKSEEKGNQ